MPIDVRPHLTSVRQLREIEVDTIRVALELLAHTDPRNIEIELEYARQVALVTDILGVDAIARLSEELAHAATVTIGGVEP